MNAVQSTVKVPTVHVVTVGERGPPGPPGVPGTGDAPKITAINTDVNHIYIGQPIFMKPDGTIVRADAVAAPYVMGLAFDSIISVATYGLVQTSGALDATAVQWNAVTGGTAGLVTGARYALSKTPGLLTTTPDLTGVVAFVGRASSSTRFIIDIFLPVFP